MKMVRALCALLMISAAVIVLSAPAAFSAEPEDCADVMVLGIAGSSQGPGRSGNGDDFGAEVGEVVTSLRRSFGGEVRASSLNYQAGLDLDLEKSITSRRFPDLTLYDRSHAQGVRYGTAQLVEWAKCTNAKFVLIGYSQGAHVAGDLADSIRTTGAPFAASRLLQTILIADPRFNPQAAGAVRVGGVRGVGVKGARSVWPESFPHVSVCIDMDIVCDFRRESNAHLHRTYTKRNWPGEDVTITQHLGRELGRVIDPLIAGGPDYYPAKNAFTIGPERIDDVRGCEPFSVTFSADGGRASYSWDIRGSVPGLAPQDQSNTSIRYSGVPWQSGPYSFTVQSWDARGYWASKGYTIVVREADTVKFPKGCRPN